MRKIFCSFLILILLLVSVCIPLVSCNAEEEIVLYVYNWGEYISDGSEGSLDTNAEFETYCKDVLGLNVSVNYSTYSSNESMYAKVSSGSAVYDVIIPSDYMIQRMISENLLLPLDLSKIPNYQYINDSFKGENVYYEDDSDNVYSIPYFYGMIGIIYNTEIVSEEDAALESWGLMWDKEYSRDILQFNNSRDAFGTALYKLGYDVNDFTKYINIYPRGNNSPDSNGVAVESYYNRVSIYNGATETFIAHYDSSKHDPYFVEYCVMSKRLEGNTEGSTSSPS